MKRLSFLPLFLVASCADRPVVYTGTQLGAHVQGIKENVPQKVSLGYDRTELAWIPNGNAATVKGLFDGEFHPLAGAAIRDELATGDAASNKATNGNWEPQSMLVSTSSNVNLGINASQADGASPSFNFGFKRSALSLFPKSNSDLPPTRSAFSVHSSGLTSKIEKPQSLTEKQWLQSPNGIRITQAIATGKAAQKVPKEPVKPPETDASPKKDTPDKVKALIETQIQELNKS